MNDTSDHIGPGKNRAAFLWFYALAVILLLFSVFCYFQPSGKNYSIIGRTWGFDHIVLYSLPLRILFFAVLLAFILPYTNQLLVKLLSRAGALLQRLSKQRVLFFLLLGIASVFVFHALRNKYYFLGDFNLRLEQIMRKEVLATEYLTMRLLYFFASHGATYGYTPYDVFAWYSCIAGGVFVFFSCLIADILGQSPLQKLFFILAQLGSSLLLVFCGYIEIYATPVVLLTMYLYAGLYYLKHKKGFLAALVLLVVAVAAHLLSIVVVPSVFVLWYFNNKSRLGFVARASNKKIAYVLATCAVAVFIMAFKKGNSFVLPMSPPAGASKNYMTFFSIKHFWEFFNGQILACGLSFLLIFYVLNKIVRQKTGLDGRAYFLLSITGCTLFVVFLANLHRGSCDWDIMAFTAISLNLLTVLLITTAYKDNSMLRNYLLMALVGINALQAFLWLHVNHTDRSIVKIERMLLRDPGTYYAAKLPSIIQLSLLYRANNLWKETEETSWASCDNYNHLGGCLTYASILSEENKQKEASVVFETMLQKGLVAPEAYLFLLKYFEETKQPEKMLKYLNDLFEVFVQQPTYFMKKVGPVTYADLFSYLYQLEAPKKDVARLERINATVQALRNTKTPAKK